MRWRADVRHSLAALVVQWSEGDAPCESERTFEQVEIPRVFDEVSGAVLPEPQKHSFERLEEDSTKCPDCEEIPEQVERTSIEDEHENVVNRSLMNCFGVLALPPRHP